MTFNGVACFARMVREYRPYWVLDPMCEAMFRGLVSARISASGSPAALAQATEIDMIDDMRRYRVATGSRARMVSERPFYDSGARRVGHVLRRLLLARMSQRTRGLTAVNEEMQMEQICHLFVP